MNIFFLFLPSQNSPTSPTNNWTQDLLWINNILHHCSYKFHLEKEQSFHSYWSSATREPMNGCRVVCHWTLERKNAFETPPVGKMEEGWLSLEEFRAWDLCCYWPNQEMWKGNVLCGKRWLRIACVQVLHSLPLWFLPDCLPHTHCLVTLQYWDLASHPPPFGWRTRQGSVKVSKHKQSVSEWCIMKRWQPSSVVLSCSTVSRKQTLAGSWVISCGTGKSFQKALYRKLANKIISKPLNIKKDGTVEV